MPAYGSPWLIAASRVLRRFPVPRHPLYALSNLANKFLPNQPTQTA